MAESMLSANELMIKAVRDFDHDALVRMLAQGVFADTRQWDDGTALHVCAETDNYEAMAILLAQRRAPNINAQNRVGDTPLRVACERGGLRCVAALISARQFQTLNVDLRGNGGFTPLMAACANNRTSCVRALLDAPIAPDLDLTDYQNRTALDLAPTDLIRDMLREFAAKKAAKSEAAALKLAEEQATQLEHAAAESQARAASIQKWIDAQAEAAANARAAVAAEAERFRARVTPKQAHDALACKESSERKTVLQMLAEAIKSRDLETLEKALEVDARQSAWSSQRTLLVEQATDAVAYLKMRKRKPSALTWAPEDIVLALKVNGAHAYGVPELLLAEVQRKVTVGGNTGADLRMMLENEALLGDFLTLKVGVISEVNFQRVRNIFADLFR